MPSSARRAARRDPSRGRHPAGLADRPPGAARARPARAPREHQRARLRPRRTHRHGGSRRDGSDLARRGLAPARPPRPHTEVSGVAWSGDQATVMSDEPRRHPARLELPHRRADGAARELRRRALATWRSAVTGRSPTWTRTAWCGSFVASVCGGLDEVAALARSRHPRELNAEERARYAVGLAPAGAAGSSRCCRLRRTRRWPPRSCRRPGTSRKSAARVNWPERNWPSIDCGHACDADGRVGTHPEQSRWLPGALRSSTTCCR